MSKAGQDSSSRVPQISKKFNFNPKVGTISIY